MKNIWFVLFLILAVSASSQVTELWNVSPGGGLNQHGLIYKINGDGSGFEEIVSMDSLNADNLCSELTLSQGHVYGFAFRGDSAFLYRVNINTHSYEKVINLPTSISSSRHFSKLTGVNGRYYFVSASGGINGYGGVYAYDTAGQSILSLTDFSTQTGFYPIDNTQPLNSGRINGLIFADSSLFGVAILGGLNEFGTIYKYNLSNNSFEIAFNFGGNNGVAYPTTELVVIDDYHLLGFCTDTTKQVLNKNIIYAFNRKSNYFFEVRELNNFEGVYVVGQIAYAPDGYVYASARHGGAFGCSPPKDYGCGTLIRYRPSDDIFEKLYDFYNPSDGSHWSGKNYNYFNSGLTFGYDGNVYSTAGSFSESYAYSFNITTKVFTNILSNYLKSPPLTPSGYYNFVNVTNGYLGINPETISNIDVKVYPNPTNGVVNIELFTDVGFGIYTFEIIDLLGRTMYKTNTTEKTFQVSTEAFSPGLYNWVITQDQETKTGKLLIATHD